MVLLNFRRKNIKKNTTFKLIKHTKNMLFTTEDRILIKHYRVGKNMVEGQLSGYRANYGCQDVLLHFINICKKALDDGNVCMALLTDLSKAFDCLPYRLLICKLRIKCKCM